MVTGHGRSVKGFMRKDRFTAFFDAILAIIMTLIVLEFVIPNGTEWSDLGTLWFQIIAYAISFFWLGGMWINIHYLWHDAECSDGIHYVEPDLPA